MRLSSGRFFLSLTILTASVCLALGITMPILKLTTFTFWTTEHSLISTVGVLLHDKQTFLGLIVLVFSILLPITKLLYLLLVSTLPPAEIVRHHARLRALEWLGKWSMHDVLVLALTIFFIKSQGVYDASSLNGVYFFTAAVVLMILSYAWIRTDGMAAAPQLVPVLPEPDVGQAAKSAGWRNFALSFLIILATVFFALGIILPTIRFTTVYVWTNEHSILTIMYALSENKEYFLCARRFRGVRILPVPEAVLSADAHHRARHAGRFPQEIDRDDGMGRALLDDRRDGARVDDLLRQFVWLYGSARAAGRLLFRRLRADDDARLWLGQCRAALKPAQETHQRWRTANLDRSRASTATAKGGVYSAGA